MREDHRGWFSGPPPFFFFPPVAPAAADGAVGVGVDAEEPASAQDTSSTPASLQRSEGDDVLPSLPHSASAAPTGDRGLE